jgi:hypothetical protein
VIGGTAKIGRKTSYGTARSDVLTLDVIGAFYDTDRSGYSLGWGAYANPIEKSGWNSYVRGPEGIIVGLAEQFG